MRKHNMLVGALLQTLEIEDKYHGQACFILLPLLGSILHQAAIKHSERRMKSPDRGKQRKNEAAHKWF